MGAVWIIFTLICPLNVSFKMDEVYEELHF